MGIRQIIKRFKEEAECYSDGHPLNVTNVLFLILFNPGFQLNIFYRLSRKLYYLLGNKPILWLVPELVAYIEVIVTGSKISPHASIGKRFRIHYGTNIVIGASVEIGNDVTIFNGVSLGSAVPGLPKPRQPKIGNGVFIGTGAKVLGGVIIGNNVQIGANAVVLDSFGPDVTVAGVPAKIVRNMHKLSPRQS